MPANVRRLFQQEEPAPYRQLESARDQLERQMREGFGGLVRLAFSRDPVLLDLP
jgi:hypothetical protein